MTERKEMVLKKEVYKERTFLWRSLPSCLILILFSGVGNSRKELYLRKAPWY